MWTTEEWAGRQRFMFSLKHPHCLWGAHPTCCSVGFEVLSLRVKTARVWSWRLIPYNADITNEWSYTSSFLYDVIMCTGTTLPVLSSLKGCSLNCFLLWMGGYVVCIWFGQTVRFNRVNCSAQYQAFYKVIVFMCSSSPLDLNIPLSSLFTDTFNPCSSLRRRGKVSHYTKPINLFTVKFFKIRQS